MKEKKENEHSLFFRKKHLKKITIQLIASAIIFN